MEAQHLLTLLYHTPPHPLFSAGTEKTVGALLVLTLLAYGTRPSFLMEQMEYNNSIVIIFIYNIVIILYFFFIVVTNIFHMDFLRSLPFF